MRAVVTALALALAMPAAALGAVAPQLVAVGAEARHPKATWTLPPFVDASVVEVATSPETASDGQFFEENVEVFDTVNAPDTSWLYEERLKPGTYYVHVRGWDNSCFHNNFTTECGSAWSNVIPMTIRNARPTVRALGWTLTGHGRGYGYYVTVTARVRACDDLKSSSLRAIIDERKWLGSHTFARQRTTRYLNLRRPGCQVSAITWRLDDAFFGVGNYTVRLWLADEDGAMSTAVRRNWYTSD